MAVQITITLIDGTIIRGLNWRMDPSIPPSPSTPNSYNGGQYHIETAAGWVDIDGNQIQNVNIHGTRST